MQTWTLAVEVSFYAALPLYGAACSDRSPLCPRSRAVGELVGAVVLYAGGLATRGALYSLRGTGVPATRWLPAQLDLFALGIGLAVLSAAGADEIEPADSIRGRAVSPARRARDRELGAGSAPRS